MARIPTKQNIDYYQSYYDQQKNKPDLPLHRANHLHGHYKEKKNGNLGLKFYGNLMDRAGVKVGGPRKWSKARADKNVFHEADANHNNNVGTNEMGSFFKKHKSTYFKP